MIRGTAVNANGRIGETTRPSVVGQEAVIRKAYENAGNLLFSSTTFSSARVGPPQDRMLIGSIKTNLGHTEGASAIASIMKIVLSLEAGEVSPSYGVETLILKIDFEGAKVEVVRDRTVLRPEGQSAARKHYHNSFGFGVARHCIIDHVNIVLPHHVKPGIVKNPSFDGLGLPSGHKTNGYTNGHQNGITPPPAPLRLPAVHTPKKITRAEATNRQLVLLPFSANSGSSLKLNIHALSHIAYTLGPKRASLQQRSFRIVDKDDAAQGLGVDRSIFVSPIQSPNIGFIFTG
ncbi:MAG: hypothetical protein Q9187_006770 [Circinaria calcarea]